MEGALSFKLLIGLTCCVVLAGCSSIGVPYTPARLANGVDRDAIRLNDAHTRAINGVITLNVLRARDGWPTGYTTLSGIQFTPQVELDLTGNFTPLGLGNPPLPFGESNATIERDESSNAQYSVNPFADEEGSSGLYNVQGTEEVFERFIEAGWPIEVLFPLMVRSVKTKDGICKIDGYRNLRSILNRGTDVSTLDSCWSDVGKVFQDKFAWEYKLKTSTDPWVCNKLMNESLINDPQEGLAARITAINSAATGADGKVSSRVLINASGASLCSRKTNTDKTLHIVNDKTTPFEEIKFRSFDDMIYFVGETLRTVDGENKLCIENCFEPNSTDKMKRYLFTVEEGLDLHIDHAVKVNHAGKNYYALKAGLRKDSDFNDRSGTVLAILSQILLLNQSEAFLEAPDNILLQ